jgi:hypothetical protein
MPLGLKFGGKAPPPASAPADAPVRDSVRYYDEAVAGPIMVDFAIKFDHLYPEDMDGDDEAAEAKTMRKKRREVVNAIKFCGLTTVRRQSAIKDDKGRPKSWIIFVSGSEDVISKEAERLKIDKLLKPEYADEEAVNPTYDEYSEEQKHTFQSAKYSGNFFTSLERQRCIYTKIEAALLQGGAGLDLDALKMEGVITDWTFMPNDLEEETLMGSWVTNYLKSAPVHDVRAYLGEKVGFYFGFLDHYLYCLMPLSIFSLAVFLYQMVLTGQTGIWQTDNVLVPFYAIVISLWSTVMLETWKRRQSVLAYEWNATGYLEDEPPRPEYLADKLTKPKKGIYRPGIGFIPLKFLSRMRGGEDEEKAEDVDDALLAQTEGATFVFPYSIHVQRVAMSLAFTVSFIAAVACGALFTMAYKIVLINTFDQVGNYLGSAINVVFIALTDQMWSRIALILNDWEMYRTDSEWYDALIYKTFLFRFLNKNITPFYIAFVQGLQLELFGLGAKDSCPNEDCLRALSDYLLVAVVFSEVSRNLLTLVPLLLDYFRKRKADKARAAAFAPPARSQRDSQQLMDSDDSLKPALVLPPLTPVERVEAEFDKSVYPGTFDEVRPSAARREHRASAD